MLGRPPRSTLFPSTPPFRSDECDGTITATTTAPATFGQGDYVITWTFTDSHTNTSTQTQAVHVHDTTPPTITCPADITVFTTNTGGTTVSFSLPSGADNCAVQSVVANPSSGSSFAVGTTPVSVTVTDSS